MKNNGALVELDEEIASNFISAINVFKFMKRVLFLTFINKYSIILK